MKQFNPGMSSATLISSDSTSGAGTFTPTTPPMSAANFGSVRARFMHKGSFNVESRPGVQYSADGLSWDAATELTSTWGGSSMTALAETSLPPVGVTERALVRFGYFARRTSGSVPVQQPIYFQFTPAGLQAKRYALEVLTISTLRSTTPAFFPATDAINVRQLTAVRGTLEVLATSGGGSSVALGYWLSKDGITWGSAAILPGVSYQTSVGVFASGWDSAAAGDNTLVQFGYLAKDASSPSRVNFASVVGAVDLK
jgi:hypothetical protein